MQSAVDHKEARMELGAFSIRFSVKDIHASQAFYEKLGFKVFGGDISQNCTSNWKPWKEK